MRGRNRVLVSLPIGGTCVDLARDSIFCVFCPVVDFVKRFSFWGLTPPPPPPPPDERTDGPEMFSDAKARKLCSSSKENLAQTWRSLDLKTYNESKMLSVRYFWV